MLPSYLGPEVAGMWDTVRAHKRLTAPDELGEREAGWSQASHVGVSCVEGWTTDGYHSRL